MSSSHNFHIGNIEDLEFVLWDGVTAAGIRIKSKDHGVDICIFCQTSSRDKLNLAIDAFNREMQREPVAQQEAAEAAE